MSPPALAGAPSVNARKGGPAMQVRTSAEAAGRRRRRAKGTTTRLTRWCGESVDAGRRSPTDDVRNPFQKERFHMTFVIGGPWTNVGDRCVTALLRRVVVPQPLRHEAHPPR